MGFVMEQLGKRCTMSVLLGASAFALVACGVGGEMSGAGPTAVEAGTSVSAPAQVSPLSPVPPVPAEAVEEPEDLQIG
jgi:hypothetical protein